MQLLKSLARALPRSSGSDASDDPKGDIAFPATPARSRIERLQTIAELDTLAARAIADAQALLDQTLDDCPGFYVEEAAEAIRAARAALDDFDSILLSRRSAVPLLS